MMLAALAAGSAAGKAAYWTAGHPLPRAEAGGTPQRGKQQIELRPWRPWVLSAGERG